MRGPDEESSALLAANRRRTVVVLLTSAALLIVGIAWAAYVGRDRPSQPELAAREFYDAVLDGDCALARALLTDTLRRTGGAQLPCGGGGPRPSGQVTGASSVRKGDDWAIVVVRAEVDGLSRESVAPLGLRYESAGGRWQVDHLSPRCIDPDQSRASGRCDRWDWP